MIFLQCTLVRNYIKMRRVKNDEENSKLFTMY